MQRGSVEQRKSMGMAKRYGPVMTALRQGGDGGGRLTLQPGGMGGGGTRGFTPRTVSYTHLTLPTILLV